MFTERGLNFQSTKDAARWVVASVVLSVAAVPAALATGTKIHEMTNMPNVPREPAVTRSIDEPATEADILTDFPIWEGEVIPPFQNCGCEELNQTLQ